jgi:hypothetical protein
MHSPAKVMLQRRSGCIVNVPSIAGIADRAAFDREEGCSLPHQ